MLCLTLCVLFLAGCTPVAEESTPTTTELEPFTGKRLTTLQLDVIPGSIRLSDENKMVIAEAVNNAIKTPFEVTQSAHKN